MADGGYAEVGTDSTQAGGVYAPPPGSSNTAQDGSNAAGYGYASGGGDAGSPSGATGDGAMFPCLPPWATTSVLGLIGCGWCLIFLIAGLATPAFDADKFPATDSQTGKAITVDATWSFWKVCYPECHGYGSLSCDEYSVPFHGAGACGIMTLLFILVIAVQFFLCRSGMDNVFTGKIAMLVVLGFVWFFNLLAFSTTYALPHKSYCSGDKSLMTALEHYGPHVGPAGTLFLFSWFMTCFLALVVYKMKIQK